MNDIIIAAHERLSRIKAEIVAAAERSGRSPEDVTLVAVSKYQPVTAIAALYDAGQAHFGENYVQEAQTKQEELRDRDIHWHFIGKLQTNKVKFACGQYSLIHTVDSLKLAQTLHLKAEKLGVVQSILLQVNIGSEDQKAGIAEGELEELARQCIACTGLRLQGLMCMPPFCDDPEEVRPFFRRMRELRDTLEQRLGQGLEHLSMGMSADFSQAVEEGATLVRVGTALFGPRPVRRL